MKLMNSGNLLSNRTRISALLLALMLLLLTGCSSTGPAETGALTESGSAEETTLPTVTEPASKNEASEPYSTKSSLPEGTDRMFYAHVNGKVLKILAAENSSADAFLDLLKSGDVPVEMHDYGSFEKVGPLGTTLPRNDEQITTEPGDVILYQSDQITIYYDVNNWSFTRLGKVQDLSQAELKDILGSGNVTVTFSLSEGRMEPESSKVLVVIFSRTGHTKPLAEYIAEDLNADLYEIEAKAPYTDDDIKYYTNCRADREQNDPSARPEIAGELPDVTGYDTVFIGYPIWHGQAPKIIYTFLEGVDLSGKTIIPFCTSHSSPLGTSAENLHPLAPDAAWMEGRRFAIGTTAGEISEWVKSLDILSGQPADTGVFDFEKQTVLLNSGYEMPIIGHGTWTLSDDEAENSVYHALKSGMRLIDTARYYGNEVGVGRGLQKAIDEGIVTREDVFITSKIYGGNYERAGGIIDDALKDLNVDYIDLMLIHQPGYDDEGVYKAMEDAVRAGKLRSIGISNYYTKEQVDEVLSFATIVPAVIQNENHLYYQNTELQEYASQYGIVIESWYPFGGRGHTSEHFGNEVIKELAEKYGKSSAQIILRWQLQAGFIAIPGSSNPDHIAENYDIFDFELSKEDMQRIRELDQHERYENW
ncbi:MAG: aldo/keto reductase [Parasporobacterium sp.]|nr:aldo/keto reductase [Parasporobacterium sp.]